jgi:hypothetical protein
VFEDSRQWRVSEGRTDVEVYLRDPEGRGEVIISIDNRVYGIGDITLTAEEATLLKEFLIRKGY